MICGLRQEARAFFPPHSATHARTQCAPGWMTKSTAEPLKKKDLSERRFDFLSVVVVVCVRVCVCVAQGGRQGFQSGSSLRFTELRAERGALLPIAKTSRASHRSLNLLSTL